MKPAKPAVLSALQDNAPELSIDNSIKDLIDNLIDSTITLIQTPHELSIIKLKESEALLNDSIAQFEAAKLSVHNATTAPQPVVNMDEVDLESEAVRVAAIESQQALALRTAQLVLIARRTRVHNAIHAVKNAVEAVNDEVSLLLQNRMKILETQFTPMLTQLNEFRHVAAALGWRSGSLSEAVQIIESDYVLSLPDVTLPRRVQLPNGLAVADIALNGTTAPKPLDGTLQDGSLFNSFNNGRIQPDGVQELAEQYRDSLKVDSLIQKVVERHDGRRFTSAPAYKPPSDGAWVNVVLPCGGTVHAY